MFFNRNFYEIPEKLNNVVDLGDTVNVARQYSSNFGKRKIWKQELQDLKVYIIEIVENLLLELDN